MYAHALRYNACAFQAIAWLSASFEVAFHGRFFDVYNLSAFLSDGERLVRSVATCSVWRCVRLATRSANRGHQKRHTLPESILAGSDLYAAHANALVETKPLVFALTARGGNDAPSMHSRELPLPRQNHLPLMFAQLGLRGLITGSRR